MSNQAPARITQDQLKSPFLSVERVEKKVYVTKVLDFTLNRIDEYELETRLCQRFVSGFPNDKKLVRAATHNMGVTQQKLKELYLEREFYLDVLSELEAGEEADMPGDVDMEQFKEKEEVPVPEAMPAEEEEAKEDK